MKKILIWLIRFYQKKFSPLKRYSSCRFIPTCSSYAIESLEKHNIIKGLILILKRILRCHPLCKGGYDPVP